MIIFLLIGIWLFLGVCAEIIGILHFGKLNSLKAALWIIVLGFLSLAGICMEIEDEKYE